MASFLSASDCCTLPTRAPQNNTHEDSERHVRHGANSALGRRRGEHVQQNHVSVGARDFPASIHGRSSGTSKSPRLHNIVTNGHYLRGQDDSGSALSQHPTFHSNLIKNTMNRARCARSCLMLEHSHTNDLISCIYQSRLSLSHTDKSTRFPNISRGGQKIICTHTHDVDSDSQRGV